MSTSLPELRFSMADTKLMCANNKMTDSIIIITVIVF